MNEKMLREPGEVEPLTNQAYSTPAWRDHQSESCVWVAQTTKERRQRVKSCDGMEINVFIEIKVFNYHI